MKTLKHLFTALLLMVATVAMAHDFEVRGIYYSILSEEKKTVEVTYRGDGYSSYSNEYTGSVDIPSSVIRNGITYAVTSIGYRAFYNCSGLTSIKIPNSVTSIANWAFDGCTGLVNMTIGNNVTSIGSNAFEECTGLKEVHISDIAAWCNIYFYNLYANPLYHANNLYLNGELITDLVIPDNITIIKSRVFAGCTGITSVTIGNGVTSIEEDAFYSCSGLKKIDFNCKNIGSWFKNNTSIEEVIIGNGVTSIEEKAFYGCTGLKKIDFNCKNIGSWFENNTSIEEVIIGNGVTSIEDRAFYGCTGLVNMTIGNSVTSIGYRAFYGCSGLKEVHISDLASWCNIDFNGYERNPLYYAHNLYLNGELVTELIIPDGVSKIKNYAFYGCSGFTSVTIPNSVTSIGDYAFSGCSGLTSITIPNSVTSIGSDAFYGCDVKKAIWLTNTPPTGYKNVGATINYVANNQYSGLSNVKVYPYLNSLFEVGGVKYVPVSPAERTCDAIDCVYDSTAVDINIEKTVLFKGIAMNVKQVMPYIFYANKNIKTIRVDNDGIVGNYAFNGCTSLNSATISNNGYIGERAFSSCTTLASVEISNNGNVGIYAFNGCTSLNSATISNNGGIGDYAFSGCSSLVTATLGDSIESIGASAFYGCSKLSEIVIPDAVTAIGSSVFRNCTSLETVKAGNGTKSIDSYAFGGCSALSSITLGDSVTTIGSDAFYACSSLPEIVIPQSVTKINSYAFDNCRALADVIIEDRTTALSLGSNGSSPLFSDCPLDSVYIGGKITYSTSSSYGYSPFYRNTSLRSVVITDTEEEVYDNEFYGCSNLKNVSIGNGVKKIGNWAFSGCSALDYFAFGNSVQSIGEEAFSDCNNVTKLISSASTPPVCGTQALDDINKWNCTLYVSAESYNAYLAAEQWKEFFFMESIATETYTVTYIVDNNVYHVDTYVLNDVIVPIEAPVKDNRIFSHWEALPETMPAKNIEVVAVYDPVPTEVTITINQYGSGTYCSEYALDFSAVEGLKAYAATGYNVNTGVVTLTRVQTAREGTGLFVKGDPGEYVVPIMESSDDYSLNMLVGTLETTVVNAVSDDGMYRNYKYTIKEGDSAPLFYQFEDNSSLSANRAYLQIPLSWVSSASKSIAVRFDEGEATDIDEIQGETGEESLIYDMQGRVVENPAKGIYLINGKKVLVK